MNILVLTYGTRGDVQPFVALSRGLQQGGHAVTLASAKRFQALVQAHGVAFEPLGDELLNIIDTQQGRRAMEGALGFWGILKANLKLLRRVKPLQVALVEDCWTVAGKVRPDLILFHPKAFAAYALSDRLKVPLIMALLAPMIVPSRETPHLGFPKLKLGRWYNRLTHGSVQLLMRLPAGRILNTWRRQHGLEPKPLELFRDGTGASIPVVAGYSGSVVDTPGDWPANSAVTGYWFLESETSETLPEEVEMFLRDGNPPVCFGFGSMVGSDPSRLRDVVLNALKRTGQRGLIISGWGGLSIGPTPEGVLEVPSAPHDLLFPRVAAVVHHGGAGTTAAALRAGKPQVVVPFMGDQPFWSKRMQALEVAPAPLFQKDLTASNLADAINRVVSETAFRSKAQTLGETIRSEKGVHHAVAFIESV
ncbi:glycosyltransferase [Aestuariibius sp. 2305UL40-4]|uniref:glycosyltransferase n=1 Tax=Aestuariibius violaceus TaxID=3234132 RepID=UPI00345EE236